MADAALRLARDNGLGMMHEQITTRPALALFPGLRRQLALLSRQPTPFVTPPDLADWRKLILMAAWSWRAGR